MSHDLDAPLYMPTHLWLILSILLCTVSLVSAQTYRYETVDVPLTGIGWTRITGMTDRGTMSGIYLDTQANERSWFYRRDKGQFEVVEQPGKHLIVQDINSSMCMSGEYLDSTGSHGFVKKESQFTTIRVDGAHSVQGCGLNTIGLVVCTYQDARGTHGLLYDLDLKKVVKSIDVPGALQTSVGGINNANDIVGAFDENNGQVYRTRGFLVRGDWNGTEEKVTVIDAPCGGGTSIRDINDHGIMAVMCFDMPSEGDAYSYAFDGVRWKELRVPDSYSTQVTRVNNAGELVGWYDGGDGKTHGFIARPQ
jgi:hypothetical protein